jgi:hypothetical protein
VPPGDDHPPEDISSDMYAASEAPGEPISNCRFPRRRDAGDEHHRGVVSQRHGEEVMDGPQRASVRNVHASTSATTVTVMAKQRIPTPEDRNTAIRVALSGIADDLELGKLAERLAPLHPKNDTFPGEVLLELAADAIEEAGATREQPLEVEGIRKRHLPEDRAHTKAQHHKAEYALRAAAMIRAGVDPGLLDEVIWWRTDDLWFWALEALVTYVRAAAERTDENVSVICGRIAGRHGVQLAAVS